MLVSDAQTIGLLDGLDQSLQEELIQARITNKKKTVDHSQIMKGKSQIDYK